MTDYIDEINDYLYKLIDTINKLDKKAISDVINVLEEALNNGRSIYVFGNGGSASTASHMQNDFSRGISEYSSKKFKIFCLSDNVATLTAIANDYSYDDVYLRQLEGRLECGDLVVAISGSGNSSNIIKAANYAKNYGAKLVGITGYDGGKIMRMSNYNLHADVNDMQIAEDIHLVFNHMIMKIMVNKFRNKTV